MLLRRRLAIHLYLASASSRLRAERPLRLLYHGLLLVATAAIFYEIVFISLADPNWQVFYSAGRAVWQGQNPYFSGWLFNPPWLLVYLAPLALIPELPAKVIFTAVNFISFGYVGMKWGASPRTLAALLLSFPVVTTFINANVDGLVLLGLILPPRWGLFFLVLKPQLGLGVAVFWLFEVWRKGGWRESIRTFAPVTMAFVASLLLFGLWPLQVQSLQVVNWNMSLFPITVPLGVALLIQGVRYRNIRLALPASLCLSPYLSFSSWSGALLALVKHERMLILAALASWMIEVALVLARQPPR